MMPDDLDLIPSSGGGLLWVLLAALVATITALVKVILRAFPRRNGYDCAELRRQRELMERLAEDVDYLKEHGKRRDEEVVTLRQEVRYLQAHPSSRVFLTGEGE